MFVDSRGMYKYSKRSVLGEAKRPWGFWRGHCLVLGPDFYGESSNKHSQAQLAPMKLAPAQAFGNRYTNQLLNGV